MQNKIHMKISFIEPHLKLFGGIRRILELSNRLTERGHDVTIFHSDGSPCEWMECIAKIKSAPEVLNEEHDVLIYNDPNPVDYALVHESSARVKVFYVLALYEMDLLRGFKPKICFSSHRRTLFVKTSLQSPFVKMSNATWLVDWLWNNLGIDSHLLIGGVNSDMFHPVDVKRKPDQIRVLCSGDPRKRKGTPTILEAVEIAKCQEPRLVLDTYHGKGIPQEKMAEKYSSADVFVDAQWQAGWNNPVAEAMACKVPVVCTDIGGVQDFAFHEKTALLVPPRAPQKMASAILRLIEGRDLARTLSNNAYQHIRQFSWDQSAKTLEEILLAELKNGRSSYANDSYASSNWIFIGLSNAFLQYSQRKKMVLAVMRKLTGKISDRFQLLQ